MKANTVSLTTQHMVFSASTLPALWNRFRNLHWYHIQFGSPSILNEIKYTNKT